MEAYIRVFAFIPIFSTALSSNEILEEILKGHMLNYKDKEYLVFEVASIKEPDQFGKIHTTYISKKEA
ncbi:hypothetical protein [Cyclobacterium plantarum]|uniref:Uncharacterized protein n=1 Tax=Cyclobacterium plantarum TaxID=2716263 RepID=A0ABX0H8I6_9BACT|nr:hypothetical protein [Cyclobacterium plantarum]NHE56512.1 hypothetical protein [Cyclobacterium plantarum]